MNFTVEQQLTSLSLLGNDATSIVNCLHILGQTLDAR